MFGKLSWFERRAYNANVVDSIPIPTTNLGKYFYDQNLVKLVSAVCFGHNATYETH